MSKKYRFRECFDKQHGKRDQTLFKSASQHLYHINRSLPSQLSCKKSPLLTSQILGLLVNILATDEQCGVLNGNNLMLPIQMQLSEKQKSFSQFFAEFLKSTLNFKILEYRLTLIDFVLSKLRIPKTQSDKRLKSPVSDDPSTSNMVNVPKHCSNLDHINCIVFIGHWEEN